MTTDDVEGYALEQITTLIITGHEQIGQLIQRCRTNNLL
jgi:uncharacterized protein with ATP-grasp and redox domains